MHAKYFLAVLLLCGLAQAQNPLAGLPSSPGSHIAQIQAMGDNQWLQLSTPAADPTWGKARGRSWGGYMAYAPDLEGAFIAGQGKHGYIKPDGRYDDLFFYDINANAWICLFEGVQTNSFSADINAGNLKMSDDGQLVDQSGAPVMLAYTGHSYKSYTYAADLHRWVTVANMSGIGGDQFCRDMQWYIDGKALLDAQMAGKTDQVSGTPFFYNAATGQFERYHFNVVTTGATASVIYYLSSKQKLWLYYGSNPTTRLGDFSTRTWASAGASGYAPQGIDFGGCYDSKRDRIVLGAGSYGPSADQDKVFSYDVATSVWSTHTAGSSFTASNYGVVLYDSVNDRIVQMHHGLSSTITIKVMNPQTFAWEDTYTAPAGVANANLQWHGFYSPRYNAHFFYGAGDSEDNGVMWAYRYKRGSNKVEAKAEARGNLSVSPNPFKETVNINYKLQITNYELKGINLAVYDIHGRCVKDLTNEIHNSSFVICNLSGLPAGVYFAQVKLGGRTYSKRMMLVK